MNDAYLLMGGNVGDTSATFETASVLIQRRCGTVTRKSGLYRTAPWGKADQQDFLNQAISIKTTLTPEALMATVLEIEKRMGRERFEKYGPRVIDIDILLIGDLVINQEIITVPHPELPYRRFALTPLADIAATHIHPILGKSIQELLMECQDQLAVTLLR